MSININLLEKKSVKERVWKSLNIVVAVATVLNISGAGIWFQPKVANAAVSSVTITASLNPIDPSTGGGAGDDKDGEPPTSGNADPSEYLLAASIVVGGSPITNATATLVRANGDAFVDSAIDNDNPRILGTLPVGTTWVYWSINKDQLVAKKDHTENFTVTLTYDGGGPTSSLVTVSTYRNSASISQNDMDFVESLTTPSAGTIGSTFDLITKYEQSSANALSEINVQTYYPGTVLRLTGVDSFYYNDSDPGTISGGTIPGGAAFTQLKNPRITSIPVTSDNNDYWIFKYTFKIIGFGSGIIAPYIQTLGQGSTWKVDSGYGSFEAAPSKISGFKFDDLNGNTTWDQNEPPIQGVTINLTGAAAGSTTTSASGYYEFANLSAGSYTVAEVIPATYTNTTPASVNVTLAPGEQEQVNFGNRIAQGTITVIKHVINDNGGTMLAPGFTMHVSNGTPSTFSGSETGTSVIVPAGQSFVVTENAVTGYASSMTGTCSGTMPPGGNLTCTVTNNDIQPKLTVTKVVVNDNGGTALVTDFPLFVDATGVTSGVQNGFNTGTYTVSETNQPGYTSVISGDCASNGSVALAAGDVKSCTITNNDQASTLIIKKILVNDNGGNAVVTDFSFKVNGGGSIAFEGDAQNDLAVNAGTYTVVENAATGYTTTYDNCSGVVIPNGGTATCTITNNDIAPTITLNKIVINNNGGNADVNDFGLTIGGSAVTSGQTVSVNANSPVDLNEAGLAGYTFVSITGDNKCPSVLNGTVTLNEGENITCTITNNDVAPTITLNKIVTNDNGGNAGVNDFGLTISGTSVTSGQTLAVNANTPIALNETGLTGYTFVSLTGDAKCPAVLNGTVTLNEGENITCTITNDDVAPTITLNKVVINDNGGTAGVNDFGLTIGGAPVDSGDTLSVSANTPIALNEAGLFGYDFVSLTGDNACPSVLNGTATLNEGENITCTITNNDIAPQLTVIKQVINTNGGTLEAGDFTMNVGGTNVSDPSFAGAEAPGTTVTLDQGSYLVIEDPVFGYDPVYSEDCDSTIAVGESKTCLVTNTAIAPHLIVVKHVINNNGGTAVAGNFTMTINGVTVPFGNSFPGEETPGTDMIVLPGTYNVTESGPSGYADSYSADCSGTIDIGETKICTVTNDDIQPKLTVTKIVTNDNGGNAQVGDFPLFVDQTSVSSGTQNGFNAGIYTISETQQPGYTLTGITEDCNPNGSITLQVGDVKSCTITNNDVAPKLTLIKDPTNDNGGNAFPDDFLLTIGGTVAISGTSYTLSSNTPYAINETLLPGYEFISITGQGCPANLGDAITLNEGDDITCTITNDDVAPTLTLVKTVTIDNGGDAVVADFPLFVNGDQVTSGSVNTLSANTLYTATETTLPGYTPTVWGGDCAEDGTITLNEGDNKTCTITNDDVAPTITLNKVVIKDNGGSAGVNDFGLTIGGTPVDSGQTLNVNANQAYALNEAGLFGYDFVSLTGDNACPSDLNGTATLNEGENITCTITNDDDVPFLTLVKNVENENGGTAVTTDWTLTATGPTTISGAGGTVSDDTFKQGTYILSESTGPAGYTAGTWSCEGGSQDGSEITIGLGENVTCEITNDDNLPSLTLIKNVDNGNGGTADKTEWTLTATGPTTISGAGGTVSDDTFKQGTYILSESTGPAGYTAGTWSCEGGSQDGSEITISLGENVTCEITNDDVAPTLKLIKALTWDNGGNETASQWELTAAGDQGFSDTGDSIIFHTVLANETYTLSENGPPGYTPSPWSCDGGLLTSNELTIDVDQDVTCTITNDDVAPTITLIKEVINNNGGLAGENSFGLTIGGTTVNSGQTLIVDANTPYALDEADLAGYDFVFLTGDEGCPQNLGDTVTLNEAEDITCTITNNDQIPSLTLIKNVITDNGGTAVAADWTLTADGPTSISGPGGASSDSTFEAGTYALSESTGPAGYSASGWECEGGTQDGDEITIELGESATCEITNDDIAPQLIVYKYVLNDDGGDAIPSNFTLNVDGTDVSPASFPGSDQGTTVTLDAGGYNVTENPFPGYTPEYLGDCDSSIGIGETKYCYVTNTDDTPHLIVVKHVINDNGGNFEADDFTMNVDGTDVQPTASFPGDENGTVLSLDAGSYNVTETGPTGYADSYDNCDSTIALGETKICTITNNDHQATVDIEKVGTPNPVEASGVITYTLTWTITGQGFVSNAVITDAIPANTTYVPASITCGTTTGTCTPNDSTSTLSWTLDDRAAGATGTVTYQTRVATPLTDGTIIENTACLNADVEQQDCDTTTTEVNSDFAVNIVKTDNIDPVIAGGQVIYTLAWTVTGNAALTNLVITDPIPANMAFVSASIPGTLNSGVVTWNLGAKLPGDFGSVTVTMQAASPIPNNTVVTNVVQVCGQMLTAQQAVVQHCDTDDETTTITSTPSLSITKANNVIGFTNPGKTVTYTVVVTNAASATDTAHAVNLTDLLPTGFTFVDGGLGTKTFALGEMAPGASVTTTYVANISAGQLAGIYTNTASAQGTNTGKVSATSNVEVRVPIILGSSTSPDLTITKKANPTTTNPGKLVGYTLVIKNIGDGDAVNVVVTDTLPDGFTYVDGGGQTKSWSLGTLEPNHQRTINYQVRVGANVKAGKYTNVAIVTADGMSAEARATVTVKVPKVLGLATTGVSTRDYALFAFGLSLIALGGLWAGRMRKRHGLVSR